MTTSNTLQGAEIQKAIKSAFLSADKKSDISLKDLIEVGTEVRVYHKYSKWSKAIVSKVNKHTFEVKFVNIPPTIKFSVDTYGYIKESNTNSYYAYSIDFDIENVDIRIQENKEDLQKEANDLITSIIEKLNERSKDVSIKDVNHLRNIYIKLK